MHEQRVCGCYGCRFEKPRLEARIAALEKALQDVVDAEVLGGHYDGTEFYDGRDAALAVTAEIARNALQAPAG